MTAFQTVKCEESCLDKTLENSLFRVLLHPITMGCQRPFRALKISPNHKMREGRMVGTPTHSLTHSLKEGRENSAGVTPSYPVPGEVTSTFFTDL